MDDLLTRLGLAVRAEVEGAVDTDAAWSELAAREANSPGDAGDHDPRRTWRWLLVAAAVIAVVAAGTALLVRNDDATVQTAEPATTVPVTITSPPRTTDRAIAPTTLASASTPPTTSDLGSVAGVPADTWAYTRIPHSEAVVDPGGALVTYDSLNRTLTRLTNPPVSAEVPFAGEVTLIAAGPDGAVYVTTPTSDIDPVGDVVAISLVDGDAGREIARAAGEADLSGDSDLVPTTAGLVRVGCCGGEQLRPAVDAPVVMGWVGPDAAAAAPLPTLRWDTNGWVRGDRGDWPVELPEGYGMRGMPDIIATFDGGFVAAFTDFSGTLGPTVVVRGWPDGTVSQTELDPAGDLDFQSLVLEPTGRVLVRGYGELLEANSDPDWDPGTEHIRRVLFDEPAVPLRYSVSFGSDTDWRVDAEGVNEEVDATHPTWAVDPVAFANELLGAPGASETRMISSSPPGTEMTIRLETALAHDDRFGSTPDVDEAIAGTRFTFRFTQAEGGLYHYVSGTFEIACQPGSGNEQFHAIEPCGPAA